MRSFLKTGSLVLVVVASAVVQFFLRANNDDGVTVRPTTVEADAPGYSQGSYGGYSQSSYYSQGTYYSQNSYYTQNSYYGQSYYQATYGGGEASGGVEASGSCEASGSSGC